MAGLRSIEEYLDQEFGPLDTEPEYYVEAGRDRAARIAAAADQVTGGDSGVGDPLGENIMPSLDVPESQDYGFSTPRMLGAGVLDVAEMVTGIPEYISRKTLLRDTGIPEFFQGVRGAIGDVRESVLSGIDPDTLDRAGREMLTLDPERSIWRGNPLEVGGAVWDKFARSLPATLAVMLPAARMFRVGSTAGALTYLGASEGGMSVGAIANNITDEITAMSHEDLLNESERYSDIFDQTGDEESARRQFISEAQGIAPLVGGAAVAALSFATGRLLKPVFAGANGVEQGMSLGARFGTGFGEEFLQEGAQGISEQVTQNFAAQIYDANRSIAEGVAEAGVQEGFIGGLTGGATAAVFGTRPEKPLPAPVEGEGGQLGLPGIPLPEAPAPQTADVGPDEAEKYMLGEAFPSTIDMQPVLDRDGNPMRDQDGNVIMEGGGRTNTTITEQQDLFDVPGAQRMSDPTMSPTATVPPVAGAQQELPLQQRQKGMPFANVAAEERIPDALDQPTPEPQADLIAQLEDMKKANGRSAVYLAPGQVRVPEIPKGAVEIRNFDGKGGTLIAKNQEAAKYARQRRAEGGSMQAIIGELTMAGTGKPNVKAGYAVQLLDENGNVARESLVATAAERNALQKEWSADGEVRVLTGPEALARRSDAIAREEQASSLRTEDRAKIDEAVGDLFDTLPTALTAGENTSQVEGTELTLLDEDGNVIVTEDFATPEEASDRADELSKDFPDAFVRTRPKRVAATPQKMGVTAASHTKRRILKGPPEGPPPRPSSEREAKPVKKEPVMPEPTPEEFDPDISLKEIEALPTFTAVYTRVEEVKNPNGTISYKKTRETRDFNDRRSAQSYATRMTNAAQAMVGPEVKIAKGRVVANDSPELEAVFASALQARADRKMQAMDERAGKKLKQDRMADLDRPVRGSEGVTDISRQIAREYRDKNTFTSKKVQLIKRERAAQLRRRNLVKKLKRNSTAPLPNRGGKVQERSTDALAYKQVKSDETPAQEKKRLAAVKEANTRLRFALNRAKKFVDRFATSGEFGVFVAENTNVDGSLTDIARDFILARDSLLQIVDLANALMASGEKSYAHAELAKQVATALERVKLQSMTPEKFAKEFSAVARATDMKMLRNVPKKYRESAEDRTDKVEKLNNERTNAGLRRDRLEGKWKNDRIWKEIIGPILRQFSDYIMQGVNMNVLPKTGQPRVTGYYHPTDFEMENLRYALRTYRKMTERYPTDDWYKPIKEQLEYLGFRFDEAGDLIIEPFSPSDELLGPTYNVKFKGTVDDTPAPKAERTKADIAKDAKKAAQQSKGAEADRRAVGPVQPKQEGTGQQTKPRTAKPLQDMDVQERRKAVRDIRTHNALLRRFKQMIAPSKTTINGIKRQEQRFIRGLRKIGAWVDVSPTMGRIEIGGWRSKTIRLVGPRLDAKTMLKQDAKTFINRMAELAMPRELAEAARRMDTDEAAANIDEFVDENTIEFFMAAARPYEYDGDYQEAASVIGDVLEAKGSLTAPEALLEILKNTPVDSFYYQLAEKLSELNLTDVDIAYGKSEDFPNGEPGKFRPSRNVILLNRDALADARAKNGTTFGAQVMHTLTHEIMHSATHTSVRYNPNLRRYFEALQMRVREYMKENGIEEQYYGLKEGKPIDEFIVEVFSNYEFQHLLKGIRVDNGNTVWKQIIDFLKKLLNLNGVSDTVFEAAMLAEDLLFEGAGISARVDASDMFMEAYDVPMREVADKFISKFTQTGGILQRVREGGKGVLNNLTSMEQFIEMNSGKLVMNGVDLFKKYYDAFRKRNAKAAEYLKIPQALSLRWSQLEASDPDSALRISQVGTEASLLRMDPRVGLDDAANEHVKGTELEADHKRLHAEYNKISDEGKKLMNEVLDYYKNAHETETLFLMQSALRGILATGTSAAMESSAFEAEFSIANLRKLESREQFQEKLAKYVGLFEEPTTEPATAKEAKARETAKQIAKLELQNTVENIYQMAVVPKQRKGIYMPAMRYGDEVTFAERKREDKFFEDRKEAMAERKSIVDNDPTLDAQVFEDEKGRIVLRVFERAFIMGETVAEVESLKNEMIADSGNNFTANDFSPIQKRRSNESESAIQSNKALDSILSTLTGNKAAQAAIKNFYLRNLSENSFRKHEVKRKNRAGLRYDLQHRNLATYAKQASYYTSQLEFGWQMAQTIKDMERALGRRNVEGVNEMTDTEARAMSIAMEHLKKRDQLSHDLPDRAEFTKKSIEATHFFMLASPSYWGINATQPWMITLPTLGAKHGWMQSAAAMRDFQSMIFSDLYGEARATWGGLGALRSKNRARIEQAFNIIDQIESKLTNQEHKDLLEHLRKNHIIDINVFTEMRDIAAGRKQNTWDRVIDASRVMAHLTEVNNRVVSALAAYQLERNAGSDVAAATEYAANIVSRTQFNYSAENKPPIFQKYPLLFQFMQWPQHMYAHLIRNFVGMVDAGVLTKSEARSTLLGLLGTHAAVGGVVGMMLQPIKLAFGLVMMGLGDDDEPYTLKNALTGDTYDRMIARVANDLFGTTVGSVVTKGLPMAAGVDLSARMSMGTLYFIDLRGDNAQSVLGALVASFGGATLNQGLKFATGVEKIIDGDVYKGLETMMPKVARDAMRAGRYYNEGLVNNAGDTIIEAKDMSAWNLLSQFLGFQPARVSNAYSSQSAIKDAESYNIGRRDDLMRSYRNATPAERRKLRQEIRQYNRGRPKEERITISQLMRNQQSKREREARYERYGANIDERKARYYERYGEPYR